MIDYEGGSSSIVSWKGRCGCVGGGCCLNQDLQNFRIDRIGGVPNYKGFVKHRLLKGTMRVRGAVAVV